MGTEPHESEAKVQRHGSADPSPSESSAQQRQTPPTLCYGSPSDGQLGWTTVWTCRDAAEANLAVGKLQAMGLHARVDMENAAALGAWGGAGPVGSTKVQAIAADAEAARRQLMEIDRRREARQRAPKVRCPRCGGEQAARKMSSVRWLAIACIAGAVIAGMLEWPVPMAVMACAAPLLALWPLAPRWLCAACGNRWIAPEPELLDDDEEEPGDRDGDQQGR